MRSNKPQAQLILAALKVVEVEDIVISPGSRNAPLVIEAIGTKNFNLHSIIDERSAAYVALGIAQSKQKPVALFCTSGSALLNYAPALAEAYYMKIPLIVISADRPEYLIEMADGQTIKQPGALQNVVKLSSVLGSSENVNDTNIQQKVLSSLTLASTPPLGPVHLNIHFDEPLYQKTIDNLIGDFSVQLNPLESTGVEKSTLEIDELLGAEKKIILLVGQGVSNPKDISLIKTIAEQNLALVLFETTSNLGDINGINAIDVFLEGLTKAEKKKFEPEFLITYKTNVVSKKVKVWLRNGDLKNHIHIGDEHLILDTYQKITHQKNGNLHKIISIEKLKGNIHFVLEAKNRFAEIKQIANNYSSPFSDFKVFKNLGKVLPKGSLLMAGNSAPIRYFQLFDEFHNFKNFCNRGTSGIEGTISTAVGVCIANPDKNVFVLIGDISFFYDSNAFYNPALPKNLKVILVNNAGGGIFRIIEGPKSVNEFEKYIETNHSFKAKGIAESFNLKYFLVTNEMEFEAQTTRLIKSNSAGVLEIITPREKNDEILKGFFSALKSND